MSAELAELPSRNRNPEFPAEAPEAPTYESDAGDTAAPPQRRARDFTATVTELPRHAWRHTKVPVPRESDGVLPAPKVQTPASEDRPSPRCVLKRYRESGQYWWDFHPAVGVAWWMIATPVLPAHLLFSSLAIMTERGPGMFWAAVVVGTLIVLLH